jgi:hypothetical protein
MPATATTRSTVTVTVRQGCRAGCIRTGLPSGEYCEHGPIPGSNNGDNIDAGNGNDVVFGGGGHNAINVGSGNDIIFGGPIGDVINVNGRNSGTDYVYLGAGGGNYVNTGQGTTFVYAQNGHVDNISCHGNTTVYADRVDHTSNCTRVIYPSPSADVAKRKASKHKATRTGRKRSHRLAKR